MLGRKFRGLQLGLRGSARNTVVVNIVAGATVNVAVKRPALTCDAQFSELRFLVVTESPA